MGEPEVKEYVCPNPPCGRKFRRRVARVKVKEPCCTRRCSIQFTQSDSEPRIAIGKCCVCRRTCSVGDVRPGWVEGEGVMCVACMSDRGIPWECGGQDA